MNFKANCMIRAGDAELNWPLPRLYWCPPQARPKAGLPSAFGTASVTPDVVALPLPVVALHGSEMDGRSPIQNRR